MKFGVHLGNGRVWTSAETITPLAERAEALGFDSVWVSDHVVIPNRIDSVYPYGPPGSFNPDLQQNYWEAFAVLAFVAGRTSRVQLGTSVLVLPQRPPLLIAKQWATLDALSGGRTILGVGAGWMREEFEALGFDTFERRGKATDEAIRLFRTAWTQPGDVSFEGEVYRFGPVRVMPKPAQPGGPPVWVGGHGRRSLRRAAELGDGWHAVRISLDELRACLATLDELLGRYGRSRDGFPTSTVAAGYAPGNGPAGPPRDYDLTGSAEEVAEKVRAYQQAGLDHLVINAMNQDSPSQMFEAIEFFARDVRPLLS